MLVADIADCCKKLRLSRNIVEMSDKIEAASHQILLKLLQAEVVHREEVRKNKLIKRRVFIL